MTTEVKASSVVLPCDTATTKMATILKVRLCTEERSALLHGGDQAIDDMAGSLYRDYREGGLKKLEEIIRTGIGSSAQGTLESAFREALRKLKRRLNAENSNRGAAA